MTETAPASPEISDSTRDGVQVLGLCRFSVPSVGGFRDKAMDLEARRAMLYDPDRMALRVLLFERITLPALAAQKDPAFRLVVMMGEDLPEPWRGRMEAHLARVPQLVAEYVAPGPHRETCARTLAHHVDPAAETLLQFRLDDDDAVAVDYTHRLRRDLRRARRLLVHQGGQLAISYARGIFVEARGAGVGFHPRIHPYQSAGLAMATSPGDKRHILDMPHHRVARYMASVSLRDEVMFLRAAHDANDSRVPMDGMAWEVAPQDMPDLLRRRFRFDAAGFADAYRALVGAEAAP